MRYPPVAFALLCVSCLAVSACDDKVDIPAPPGSPTPPAATAAATAPAPTSAETRTEASTPPASIAAQHVLVTFQGARNASRAITRTKEQAKKRAEEVSAKGRRGADFSALVAEYSEDEGTKHRLGSLGKFTREAMTPAFADVAFALAVDEVSAPVESPFGYHVIKRNQ
jgi:peptidyl-prolyl cis-trans isomerase NIMA-interacting 1